MNENEKLRKVNEQLRKENEQLRKNNVNAKVKESIEKPIEIKSPEEDKIRQLGLTKISLEKL